MAALKETKISMAASDDIFHTGKFKVKSFHVESKYKPPVDLFIVTPETKGTYPVLLFCHGFVCINTWYTSLLQHIASHGYIVVAPQFYNPVVVITTQEEVNRASHVLRWLSTGLPHVLPEKVNPDMDSLAVSGHSRGGKTAFDLALGRVDPKSKATVGDDEPTQTPKIKVLIGVDPVAGSATSDRPAPKILEYIPRCFKMSIPVALIGTGYGNKRHLGLIPPFAPNGVNHSEFFNESKPPACYFLAKDYGHCDMLDDWISFLCSFVVDSGWGSKDSMRKSVGGIVVAFLRAYLGDDFDDLCNLVSHPKTAPITLDPVIYVKE